MIFSYATLAGNSSGMKGIWELDMRSPSSTRMTKDVDRSLKALEIIYNARDLVVEGLEYHNRHIQLVLGDGKSGRRRGA